MLHLYPESVNLDAANKYDLKHFAGFEAQSPLSVTYKNSSVNLALDLSDVIEVGSWGDPSHAKASLGAEVMRRMVEFFASFLRDFDADTASASTPS